MLMALGIILLILFCACAFGALVGFIIWVIERLDEDEEDMKLRYKKKMRKLKYKAAKREYRQSMRKEKKQHGSAVQSW